MERITETDLENRDNGHEPESPQQLELVRLKLEELSRGGGPLTMGKQELTLLQTLLRTATEQSKEDTIFRMMSFMDDDEAAEHHAAYEEAKSLGMDTGWNVRLMFAKCSVQHKGEWRNLLGLVADTLQHGKWASAATKGKGSGDKNPRSPLAVP